MEYARTSRRKDGSLRIKRLLKGDGGIGTSYNGPAEADSKASRTDVGRYAASFDTDCRTNTTLADSRPGLLSLL